MGRLSRLYLELCNGLISLTFHRDTIQKAKISVKGLSITIDHHYQEILESHLQCLITRKNEGIGETANLAGQRGNYCARAQQ